MPMHSHIAPSSTTSSEQLASTLADIEQAVRTGEGMETGVGVPMLLSQRQQGGAMTAAGLGARGRVFECKTCSRRFPTFQALGGHRASHRRPKPYCPYGDPGLLRRTRPDEQRESACAPAGPRLHGCPICGLEFAVGQALGGHMRRHRRAAVAEPESGDATSVEEANVGAGCASGICLDLSLASSENCAKCRNNAVLGNTVHYARKSLMLDCPPL